MNPPNEHTMVSHDGTELFYRAWHPAAPSQKALLIFHRGHEHSGRMAELARDLELEDFHVFAWDARGHGRSPGERGHAPSLAVMIQDVECFVRHLSRQFGIAVQNMAIVAHSVGAAVVAAWVHDYAPPLRAMVLATPAFRVKLYVPLAIPALRLRQKLFGDGFVESYVKAKVLTHDPTQVAAYDTDHSISKQIAVNILLDLFDTSNRVVSDAGAINVPTLVMAAGSDWVVEQSAQEAFYRNLSSARKEFCVLAGFYHSIFHEQQRAVPIAKARGFILRAFEEPVTTSLVQADNGGFTRTEYDLLRVPTGVSRWSVASASMRSLGMLSQGLRLGWRRGFDSGETLDYVYTNRPQGTTAVGRFIDKTYLESVGWRGIRQRKAHLEDLLIRAMQELHRHERSIRIVDVAAGVGRYVLETLRAAPQFEASALLLDNQSVNLDAGRKLALELGLDNVQFELGDAFDRRALGNLSPRPNLAIISGLFELIPENSPVLECLNGLADALEDGGYLIYTNQPWHPQLEFIARVLVNREGQPWIMRRRTQAEMDELVGAAGFEKLSMAIDRWGIFSVSLAVRRRP
jgi:alpha-beta hydrolase superfamily lysophospholipase